MDREYVAQFQREQLHYAAADGDVAKVEKLLKAGYPVNRFDDLGKTPLHYAVAREHLDIVEMLLQAGANVNAHDERSIGDTPLGEAASSCSYEMAHRLMRAGADPTIPGWMMINAVDRAKERKSAEGQKVFALLSGTHKKSWPPRRRSK